MVATTALWGGTFVVIRDSLGGFDPGALVFARFAIAGLALLALGARRGRRPSGAVVRNGIVSGLLMGACYLLQAIGLRTIPAGTSAFLTCAGTLFAGFFAWPVLRQRPGGTLLLGLALALAGSATLSLDAKLHLGPGEILTLVGALCYGLGLAWVGRLGDAVDPLALGAVQAIVMAVALAPRAPLALEQLGALDPIGWARFSYLVIAGSLIASLLQLYALRALPPGRVGLLLALEPVFALVFAATVGGERFVLRWWAGAALILCAVVLVEGRAAVARPAPPSATA
jgi:drug/metabolite transporter (DMT)-like permease